MLPAHTSVLQVNPAGTSRPWSLGHSAALLLTCLYGVLAAALLTNFDFNPFAPEKIGLVFNDMARRLLAWDFTSDPAIVAYEAFVKDGRTYAYYGIFPALLRMPLVLAGGGGLQVARISCIAALMVTVYAYLRLFQAAMTGLTRRGGGRFIWISLLSVVATGPQVYLLASASLYHEVIFWAAALTALGNLIVARRWLRGEAMQSVDFYSLAVLAGTALLCRVPAGASLYVALLLLLLQSFIARVRRIPAGRRVRDVLALPRWLALLLGAGCLSLLFVVVQGVVNAGRWGSPFTLSPYEHYAQFIAHPANLARYARHGLFAWPRLAMAVAYYSTGLKLEAIWPQAFATYYGAIEGPRALVPLCAPLTLVALAGGVAWLLRQRAANIAPLLFVIAGNLLAVALMLGFLALCLRYTFDAWGVVMLLAALGLRAASQAPRWPRWVGAGAMALLLAGTGMSGLTLLRYKLVYSGTDPAVRLALSQRLQPLLCPGAPLNAAVRLTDFNPLVTPSCPPLW